MGGEGDTLHNTTKKQHHESDDRQHSSERTSYLTIQGPPAAAGAAAAATVETAPGGAVATLGVPDSYPGYAGACQMLMGHRTWSVSEWEAREGQRTDRDACWMLGGVRGRTFPRGGGARVEVGGVLLLLGCVW